MQASTHFAVNPDVASVMVDGSLLVAFEQNAEPRVLDPVTSVVWSFIHAGIPTDSIVDDLAAALDILEDDALTRIQDMLRPLAEGGFIFAGHHEPAQLSPRRIDVPVDPASCIGRTIGLRRARIVEITHGGRPLLRIGATEHSVVDDLLASLPASSSVVEPSDLWLRTIVLRLTSGRTARLQQMFDTLGDPLYAGFERENAVAALARSTHGILDAAGPADGRTWVQAPAILAEDRVVLLHPAIHRFVTGHLRPSLLQRGLKFVDSALFELSRDRAGYSVRLPRSGLGHPTADFPVAEILVPLGTPSTAVDAVRRMIHLAYRWDNDHLAAMRDLAFLGPVHYLPRSATVEDLEHYLVSCLVGSPRDFEDREGQF